MARAMMVEPDRRQRIARLTPLADVLARLDTLVRPVAPRTAELAAALGQTLAEDVIIHAPSPRRRAPYAMVGRCHRISPPMPAPMPRRRCRRQCGLTSGSPCPGMPTRSRRSME